MALIILPHNIQVCGPVVLQEVSFKNPSFFLTLDLPKTPKCKTPLSQACLGEKKET